MVVGHSSQVPETLMARSVIVRWGWQETRGSLWHSSARDAALCKKVQWNRASWCRAVVPGTREIKTGMCKVPGLPELQWVQSQQPPYKTQQDRVSKQKLERWHSTCLVLQSPEFNSLPTPHVFGLEEGEMRRFKREGRVKPSFRQIYQQGAWVLTSHSRVTLKESEGGDAW